MGDREQAAVLLQLNRLADEIVLDRKHASAIVELNGVNGPAEGI